MLSANDQFERRPGHHTALIIVFYTVALGASLAMGHDMAEQTLKVLSVRQPWASLLVSGEKWCENRTWSTNYRGPLWIHASTKVVLKACEAYEIDPESLVTGAIIGVVELFDVLDNETNSKRFDRDVTALAEEHSLDLVHGPDFVHGPLCWIVKGGRLLEKPVPVKGRLNLWNFAVAPGRSLSTKRPSPLIGSAAAQKPQSVRIDVDGKREQVQFSVEADGVYMAFQKQGRSRIAKPRDSWNYRDGEPYYRAGCEKAWELFPEHFRPSKRASRQRG